MNSKVKVKFKIPIIILTIAALLFRIISSIEYFVIYEYVKYGSPKINVAFPRIGSIISLFIEFTPIILFLIYVFLFHKLYKATVWMPIVFGLIAFAPIYNALIMGERFSIIHLFLIVSLVLAIISAIKRFSKKYITIIAFSIGYLCCTLNLILVISNISFYWTRGFYVHLITLPCFIFGTMSLYGSLFLFAIANRIPAKIKSSPIQEQKN